MDHRAQCDVKTVAGERCKNKVMPCGKCGKHHIKPCTACMRSGLVDARGRTIRKSHARKPRKSVQAIIVDTPRLILSCDDSAEEPANGSDIDDSIEQYVSESSVHDDAPQVNARPPADNIRKLRDELAASVSKSTALIKDIDKLQVMLEFYDRMAALNCAGNLAADIRDTKKEIREKLRQLQAISAEITLAQGRL